MEEMPFNDKAWLMAMAFLVPLVAQVVAIFFWVLGNTKVITAPNNATEAKAQNAASFAPPDMVLTRPIKSGPK